MSTDKASVGRQWAGQRRRSQAAFGALEQDATSGVWGFGDTEDGFFVRDASSDVLGIDTAASVGDVRIVRAGDSALLWE